MSVSSAHAVTAGCTLYVSGDVGNDGNNSSGTGAGQAFRTVQGAEEWMEKFLTTKTTYTVPFQPTTGAYSAPYTRYTVNAPQKVCIVKSATPYDSLHIPSGLADAPNPNWPANSFEAYTLEIRVSGTPQFPVTFTAYDVANPPTIRQTGYSAIQIDSTANYINITNLILTGRSYEALAHKDSTGTPVALTRYNNGQLHPVDWTFYDGDCLFVKGNPLNYTQMQFQHDATQTDATKQSPFPVGVPTHIVVDSVKAYACGGGGFGTQSADWITSSNNTVYDNAWFGLYGGEGISLEYSVDSEVYPTRNGDSPATISSRLKNRVTGNYVFDNREYVPWRADKNGPHIDDGEGIVIDTNANNYPINRLDNTTATVQRYYGQTLIADNAIWNNGSSGISTVQSGWVTIANNTLYNNRYYPVGYPTPSQDPTSTAPYTYTVFPTSIATRPEIALSYATDPIIVFDNIIYGPTTVPEHPCGSVGATSGKTYTCIPVTDEVVSSVADPGDANYQPNIYMSNNVLYKPGQTLDNPANHIVIPFGGYNNIINIDPKLAVTPPQPKPFGMPSDTNIPDFRVLSNTNPVSPAYGRYSVPSTEYPYPTDLMDILGNAQPGPNNLAGAYAVPK